MYVLLQYGIQYGSPNEGSAQPIYFIFSLSYLVNTHRNTMKEHIEVEICEAHCSYQLYYMYLCVCLVCVPDFKCIVDNYSYKCAYDKDNLLGQ